MGIIKNVKERHVPSPSHGLKFESTGTRSINKVDMPLLEHLSLKFLEIVQLFLEFKKVLRIFNWHTHCHEDCSK
jgi:hypothetical protein